MFDASSATFTVRVVSQVAGISWVCHPCQRGESLISVALRQPVNAETMPPALYVRSIDPFTTRRFNPWITISYCDGI